MSWLVDGSVVGEEGVRHERLNHKVALRQSVTAYCEGFDQVFVSSMQWRAYVDGPLCLLLHTHLCRKS